MKKLLAKLALYSIVSIILISSTNPAAAEAAATAATINELLRALGDIEGKQCIEEIKYDNNKATDGPDANYIITIIEEPLTIKESGKSPEDKFIQRKCYRNTFQFTTEDNTTHTIPELSNKDGGCSKEAQRIAAEPDYEGFAPRFSCREVQVILSKGGTTMIYGYIGMIYTWGASMVGIIAVLIIVLSGIQISAAGGDQDTVTNAKRRIVQSIAGIIVLFLSGLILYTVNPNFFVN